MAQDRFEAQAGTRAPTTTAPSERPLWRRILLSRGLAMLGGLLLVALLLSRGLDALGGPEAVRARFGWFGPVASAVIHAPLAAVPFPSELFAISHGALYGFWLGAVVGWAGWFLGSLLEYSVIRRWRADVSPTPLRITRPRWLARLPVEHPLFLIGARQLPAGYHLVNVAAAVAGVTFTRHLWCSLLSQIPTALFIAAVGAGVVRL